MSDHTVVRFPPGRAAPPGYTDTAALNDIHAIVCSRRDTPDASVVADVADVLARAGRPIMEVRDIQAAVADTPAGLPEARVDAGTTSVRVYQDHTGGLAVAIATTAADEATLTITLNRQQLHPAATHPRGPAEGGTPS
jgi:hypothetical protein